ncbi:adrenodoxin, mitochondrial [Vombatus ursinus]|nr:adrenodoxin, mitochondrial [Vombatus ursinus]
MSRGAGAPPAAVPVLLGGEAAKSPSRSAGAQPPDEPSGRREALLPEERKLSTPFDPSQIAQCYIFHQAFPEIFSLDVDDGIFCYVAFITHPYEDILESILICFFFSSSEDKITIHFINRDGEKLTAQGKVGDSLLDVVVNNNLDIDGFGACEGTLACSTCHLVFEDHIFEKLEAITDEENDMLDLAYGLTDTSRLGCQICLTKSMNNMTVRVPEGVADARQSIDLGKNL